MKTVTQIQQDLNQVLPLMSYEGLSMSPTNTLTPNTLTALMRSCPADEQMVAQTQEGPVFA